jgi:hypothetical protein
MTNVAETAENTIKVTEDDERVLRNVYTVETGPSKHYVIVAMVTQRMTVQNWSMNVYAANGSQLSVYSSKIVSNLHGTNFAQNQQIIHHLCIDHSEPANKDQFCRRTTLQSTSRRSEFQIRRPGHYSPQSIRSAKCQEGR